MVVTPSGYGGLGRQNGGVASVRHPFLDGPTPRAFAHRGWHCGELAGMENSLTAFRRAAAEGYRYLETDVRSTRDGVVVILHDPTLDRTTDGSGEVEQLDWAAVRSARVGGREPVCRLTELMEELPDALVNIDVKADSAVEPVLRLLQRTGQWHRVCIVAFSEARLRRIRKAAGPRVLTSMGPTSAVALRLRSVVPIPAPIRGRIAQIPARIFGVPVIDRRLVHYAHVRGFEVHVWTVDREAEMHALLDLGVDGLMTDEPDVLRAVLRTRRAWPA